MKINRKQNNITLWNNKFAGIAEKSAYLKNLAEK